MSDLNNENLMEDLFNESLQWIEVCFPNLPKEALNQAAEKAAREKFEANQ